jgi:hypothetical protein
MMMEIATWWFWRQIRILTMSRRKLRRSKHKSFPGDDALSQTQQRRGQRVYLRILQSPQL